MKVLQQAIPIFPVSFSDFHLRQKLYLSSHCFALGWCGFHACIAWAKIFFFSFLCLFFSHLQRLWLTMISPGAIVDIYIPPISIDRLRPVQCCHPVMDIVGDDYEAIHMSVRKCDTQCE